MRLRHYSIHTERSWRHRGRSEIRLLVGRRRKKCVISRRAIMFSGDLRLLTSSPTTLGFQGRKGGRGRVSAIEMNQGRWGQRPHQGIRDAVRGILSVLMALILLQFSSYAGEYLQVWMTVIVRSWSWFTR